MTDAQQHLAQANLITDLAGLIHYASSGIVAYSDIIETKNLHEFIAPAHQAEFTITWAEFVQSNEPEIELTTRLVFGTIELPVILNIQHISDRSEYLINIQSTFSQTEKALLPALQTVTRAIGNESLEKVLELILDYIVGFVECDGAAILSLNGNNVFQHWTSPEHHQDDYPIQEVLGLHTTAILRKTQDYLIIEDTRQSDLWKTINKFPLLSWLGIPLVFQNEFIGLIDIYSLKVNNFAPADAEMVMSFANQAAMALYNAQTHTELQKRTERLHAINDVALAISRLDLEGVLEVVYQEISTLLDTSSFYVGLYNEKTRILDLRYVYDKGERIADYSMPIEPETSLAAWVLEHQAPLVVNDAEHDTMPVVSVTYGGYTRSLIIMPLIIHDESVGVISVQSYEAHKFSQQDMAMLEIIAGPTAIAIRNAALYADLRGRLEIVSNLHELAQTIITTEDTQVMMDRVIIRLRDAFNCDACTVILREGKHITIAASAGMKEELVNHANSQWNADDKSIISGRVIRSGQAISIPDTHAIPDFHYLDPNLRSLIVIPLSTKEKTLGTLSIDSHTPHAFTDEDERILNIVGAQLAAVLDNRRLVDDLREHTQELKIAYEQLQALDELRHELVNNVSHDLRAPLSFITGYVGLMLENDLGEITPEQADALNVINRKVSAILRLIGDIMSMERIRTENLRLESVDINMLVREAVAGASIAYNTYNLTIATPENPIITQVDPDRINQVLDNLITNAIKYSEGNGFINVSTELIENGQFVKIAVEDEGVGIPPEKINRIFERYFQITEHSMAEKGVGLGLALVQQIVNAHHGQVFVESEVDKGSTFWFILPI